jgi:DNA-binding CsgD family transcriptional regulator
MINRKNIPLDMLDGEVWVDVSGFEGLYAVSNKLRVKSIERKSINGYLIKGKILRAGTHKNGYAKFSFCKNGKIYFFSRHKLIATAFIPNPLNLPCINHIDNNPKNDSIDNLEWCTFQHNTRHAIRQGRLSWVGKKNGGAKLKEIEVLDIFKTKVSSKEIAAKYNISWQTVNDIRAGRRWCELTGKKHYSVKDRIKERI